MFADSNLRCKVMEQLTLGKYIQDEMKHRDMSIRQFAELVGVTHKVIAKFRHHGIDETYNKRPVGDPSLEFLAKLAKATSIDICGLVALVYPNHTVADPRAAVTNTRISQLSPEKIEILDTFLNGLMFDHFDSSGNGVLKPGK
jgi:transcriptional regulator with XRE-family HTH domain